MPVWLMKLAHEKLLQTASVLTAREQGALLNSSDVVYILCLFFLESGKLHRQDKVNFQEMFVIVS